jgi:hypothetical protein
METVSKLGNSKTRWRDALLALKPLLDPTIQKASVAVRELFDTFWTSLEEGKGTWADVDKAVTILIKGLRKLTTAADPEAIAAMGDALVGAIEAEIQAVLSLMNLLDTLKESLRALKLEAVDFFVSLEQKINEYRGTESTRASEAIMTWAQKEIFKPLLDEATNRGAGGSETLTPAEKIALIRAGVAAVDNWVAARTTEIEQHYKLQMQANQDQVDIINKQLDVLKAWNSLLKSVKDSIKQLTLGAENPANIVEKLTYARSEVDKLKMQYEGETDLTQKAKYGEDYRVALMDYIKTAQEAGEYMAEYQGPGTEYGKIYDFVMGQLHALEATATAMGGTDEQVLAAEKEIVRLETANNELQKSMDTEIKAMKKGAADWYQWLQTEGSEAYTEQEVIINTQIDAIKDALYGVNGVFQGASFEQWRIDQLLLLKNIKDAGSSFAGSINPTTPPGGYTLSGSITQALAAGGLVTSPTFSLVGDKGPEWVIPFNQMQDILKMAASQEMRGGVGQPITQNNTQNYEINVSPQITINASGDASPKEIANEVENILINSLKYGKGRVAVQDIARRK